MRSSYLEVNSGQGNYRKHVEHITASVTLTNNDSGKVYMCSSADAAVSITLPTTSTGLDGVHYKFIVWEETPSNDITIALGSAIGSIVSKDATGDEGASTQGTQISNIILDTTAQRGDFVEIMFWGGEYVALAFSGIAAGLAVLNTVGLFVERFNPEHLKNFKNRRKKWRILVQLQKLLLMM